MKLLKTIPLLLSLAVATAQAADVNPHPQSFGTWHDADGGNFVINKNGFKEFAHVSAECGQKSKDYVHESSWISGKELAKSIRESIEIEDSDNKAYGSEMNAVLKTIRPNKKYLRIDVALSCSDGMESFIQLDKNNALRSTTAPDEFFRRAKRVK
ncbi:hypothetical protein [Neisseria elongata]|uniref:hypothetical protein n=1 Tax=Neisseria elongata TaxID=495 RepID=UPI000665E4AF|nr:hypothetical protein [Neisseria elongata]